MSTGLYSDASGLSLGNGLYKNRLGLFSSASGLITGYLPTPSLALSFATSQYSLNGLNYTDPAAVAGYTFTRASGGYAENTDGSLTYFASGIPRITNKGYLSEEARTNLVTYSQDLTNAAWAKNAVTALANQTTSPDGTVTASSMTETTATAQHYTSYATAKAASAITYSVSVYVKQFGLTRNLKFGLFDGAGNGVDTIINPVTLAVVSGPTYYGALPFTSVSVTTSTSSNGFVRIGLIFTSNVTPVVGFGIQTAIGTGLSFAGDASTGFYVWGAQLEAGAFATSYIPTTTAAATRAADVLNYSGVTQTTALTMAVKWIPGAFKNSDSIRVLWWQNSATGIYADNIQISQYTLNNVTRAFAFGFANDANYWSLSAGNVALNVPQKAAVSVINGRAALSANGSTVQTTTGSVIPTLNNLEIGNHSRENTFVNGYIQSATIYPTALTDAQLQAITA